MAETQNGAPAQADSSTTTASSGPSKVQLKTVSADGNGNLSGSDFMSAFIQKEEPVEEEVEDEVEEPEYEVLAEGEEPDLSEEAGKKTGQEEPDADKEPEEIGKTELEVSGKPIIMKLKDGKEVKFPADAKILHKVDGKSQEIDLKTALNREAGELSIEQRMTKLAHYEHNLKLETEKIVKQKDAELEESRSLLRDVAVLSQSDNPTEAIVKIAEKGGVPPGKVYKKLFLAGLEHARKFQEAGGTMADIEAYFNKMDQEYLEKQLKSRDEKESKAKWLSEAQARRDQLLTERGIERSEFEATAQAMFDAGELEGVPTDDVIYTVADRVESQRHEALISEALKGLPSITGDTKLMAEIRKLTNAQDWSSEEIRQLAVEFKKDSLGNLTPQRGVTAKPAAQNVARNQGKGGQKLVSSSRDFRSAFRQR